MIKRFTYFLYLLFYKCYKVCPASSCGPCIRLQTIDLKIETTPQEMAPHNVPVHEGRPPQVAITIVDIQLDKIRGVKVAASSFMHRIQVRIPSKNGFKTEALFEIISIPFKVPCLENSKVTDQKPFKNRSLAMVFQKAKDMTRVTCESH